MPRRRKPKKQKEVEGTYRKDRDTGEAELPAVDESEIEVPTEDLISADAVRLWKKVVKILTPVRLLSDADLEMLLHYCNLHAKCLKLWRADETPTGTQLTQLRLLAGEFGLTPASRAKPTPVGGVGSSTPADAAGEKSTDRFFDGPKLAK